jgi:hypothetical protein
MQGGLTAFDWAKKNSHAEVAQLIAVRLFVSLISSVHSHCAF